MSSSRLLIKLDGDRRLFQAGETLRASYQLEPEPGDPIESVEWSAYWRSEGKGDEDADNLEIEGNTAFSGDPSSAGRSQPVSIRLPHSPLSYDGTTIKIRWFVGTVVRLRGGEELEAELEFRLGGVVPFPEIEQPKKNE